MRVGNLVKCIVHLPLSYYRPSLLFSEILEIKVDRVETNISTHKYKEIGPIKLTEDILINSGGVKISENEILFTEGESALFVIYKEIETEKFFLGFPDGGKTGISIEAVHNFQNIYFDILRKEIAINISENNETEKV